ncbi:MAG TPA: ubiquinol oxidase subunit II [Rickettsiales bacterium]|nr:ubiquinol oxidase subunit II [Rickettsiales bacterium]
MAYNRHHILRTAAILSLVLGLTGCHEGVLAPEGPISEQERLILFDSLAVMLAIVIPTILATLGFAWWFRASNKRAKYLPEWSYSGKVELLVWSIPALVILFLGGIAWFSSHDLDPSQPLTSKEKPLEIEVVSLDWKWLFIYPEQHVASINRLVVPAGMPLHFYITSASVFNDFFVPQLGSQIYAMGGMATQLNLKADKPGVYPGLSAHFSGDGFSDMYFNVEAVPAAKFTAWVATAKTQGRVLSETEYRSLLVQSHNVKPYTYRDVAPGLFTDVVMQKLPEGEGPKEGRPAPEVTPKSTQAPSGKED